MNAEQKKILLAEKKDLESQYFVSMTMTLIGGVIGAIVLGSILWDSIVNPDFDKTLGTSPLLFVASLLGFILICIFRPRKYKSKIREIEYKLAVKKNE